jgi:hypothetical protein
MDSFDAEWTPDDPSASNGHGRCEYVLVLGSDSDTLIAAGGQTHRRCFRRGEREGWELESLAGARAREAVQRVQKEAAERADGWGRAFTPGAPAHAAEAALTLPSSGWGTSVFAAAADGTLLAAALVGWANRRAFYVSGGSTPAGYRDGAAVWLHWKIAHYLQGQGFTTYNLGGTPAGADDPSHPAHGLYRFKTGFGCEVRPRTGAHWVLSPLHLKAHRVTQRFRGVAVRPQALVDVR